MRAQVRAQAAENKGRDTQDVCVARAFLSVVSGGCQSCWVLRPAALGVRTCGGVATKEWLGRFCQSPACTPTEPARVPRCTRGRARALAACPRAAAVCAGAACVREGGARRCGAASKPMRLAAPPPATRLLCGTSSSWQAPPACRLVESPARPGTGCTDCGLVSAPCGGVRRRCSAAIVIETRGFPRAVQDLHFSVKPRSIQQPSTARHRGRHLTCRGHPFQDLAQTLFLPPPCPQRRLRYVSLPPAVATTVRWRSPARAPRPAVLFLLPASRQRRGFD